MKRNPNTSTISGEEARRSSQKHEKNIYQSLKQEYGVITEVHPTLPMVKAVFNSGVSVTGNQWIPVSHSTMDIAHRFGALRPGLKVLLTYSGEVESKVSAEVIGTEDEILGVEIQMENDFDSNTPWRIFFPGSF